ncbi:MAG: peptidase M1 [Balneolaceae bacterium]|nr:peptidase M1 [Balneolaceae bacterium]
MKIYALFLAALIMMLTSCTQNESPKMETGVSLSLAQFRTSVISDIKYDLYFNIAEDPNTPIEARETLSFKIDDNTTDIPLDFREGREHLISLAINDTPVDIQFEQEHLILPSDFLVLGENIIEIEFTAGETSLNRNPEYLYTLFVPDRARTAFPLFDQPDLKATYDLTLEIPHSWNAISNAPLASETPKDSTKVLDFSPSDLISSYLFSFAVGDFESITQTVDGIEMTMLHRETDTEKAERNIDDIFQLHAASLQWLEEYTGIDYPFQKFDFALIPTFQYGGMEHVGAIQYRASALFLEEDPSESQLLSRASLIAHETAHMWFGDLVTMEWFNDVWTKEVFANFMAAKIMNPNFPDINHELNFLLRHYPSSYSVDRTEGANSIRQKLDNLNEAGQMYGAIIYNKAPIMMRQLELLVGEDTFREGLQKYLSTYSFKNATWPDLISILDKKSDYDLKSWSQVWVNTPGRPHFNIASDTGNYAVLKQNDPKGDHRIWPQKFTLLSSDNSDFESHAITTERTETPLEFTPTDRTIYNANGYGYGLFPSNIHNLSAWEQLDEVARGTELINLYENMLEGNDVQPANYYTELLAIIQKEENQLLLSRALGQLQTIYWRLFTEAQRMERTSELETILWEQMLRQEENSKKKTFFNAFRNIALSEDALKKVYDVWNEDLKPKGLNLSERDYISMAGDLAIKNPSIAGDILNNQKERIENPDRLRRFEFIIPALSPNQQIRDVFFASLKKEENRQIESWVLGAIGYLHHPLRVQQSEKYILPSLELLQEIQVTGDIFFPKRWLDTTLGNYASDTAVQTVRDFLAKRPDYNKQLRMKILQAADMMFRANSIQK